MSFCIGTYFIILNFHFDLNERNKTLTMKKAIVLGSALTLLISFSCGKETTGNKGIIKEGTNDSIVLPVDSLNTTDNNMTAENRDTQDYTDRYVGTDGTSALVTFKNTGEEKMISVRSNNQTISAPLKEAWENGGVYANFDFEIVAKNDTITITQEDNVITLKKARGN